MDDSRTDLCGGAEPEAKAGPACASKTPSDAAPADRRAVRLSAAAILIAYTGVLIALSSIRPFWLDEVIQLTGTVEKTYPEVLQHVRSNAGAAPLGYLLQAAVLPLFGPSLPGARAVSVFFAVAGCGVLMAAGVRLRISPLLVALFWIAVPLHLRYAAEARPYLQGTFFGVAAAALFFRLRESFSYRTIFLYACCLVLGLYSQPFSIAPVIGFTVWNLIGYRGARHTWAPLAALVFALAVFSPWLFSAAAGWNATISSQGVFTITPRTGLQILREIAGGGYLASVPLLVLAGLGWVSRPLDGWFRGCVLSGVIAGILVPIAADVTFGYFFAIRQIMFVLPLLILLAAAGVRSPRSIRGQRLAAAMLIAFAAGAAVANWKYFRDGSEDWPAAAKRLRTLSEGGRACVAIPAPESLEFYAVFEPVLRKRGCSELESPTIVIPTTRYADQAAVTRLRSGLAAKGYARAVTEAAGAARIEILTR